MEWTGGEGQFGQNAQKLDVNYKIVLGPKQWEEMGAGEGGRWQFNFWGCLRDSIDKELQESNAKIMKLGKRLLITTFWENDP